MGLLVFQIKYGNSITVDTVLTQKRVSLQFLNDVNGYRIKRKPNSTFPAAKNDNLKPAEPAPFREQPIIEETVTYKKGGKEYTYTIKGSGKNSKIFNDKGKEVYSKASIDRDKIFANLAIKQKRAKVVEVEGNSYVVNKEGKVMSVDTGKIMNRETNPTLYNSIIQEAFSTKKEETTEDVKRQEKLTKAVNDQSQGQRSIEERKNNLLDFLDGKTSERNITQNNITEDPDKDSTCKK